MEKNHEVLAQQTFDSFCKKILKYAARDYYAEVKRLLRREVPFSVLSAQALAALYAMDEYFVDVFMFTLLGESIGISDSRLAEALCGLAADRRDIVLMSYFFDMSDKDIAERMNVVRRTVAYRRARALLELKRMIGSEG